jgi:LysR family positive regulator for ilvC
VVPRIVLDNSPLAQRVRVLPVKPELPHYDVGLCVLHRQLKSPLTQALWETVSER